jgi:acyl-CoA reductase-like NAD-dependent aldehyde dehydrogenase
MIPETIHNLIGGQEVPAQGGQRIQKISPHDGSILCHLPRSGAVDIAAAVGTARSAQASWFETPAVQRGLLLHRLVRLMQDRTEEIATIVAAETGKSMKDARGEVSGAVQCGLFYASEGQRLYGRTSTSGATNKYAMTVRQPIGVAGLIIAANTPIANVAWKVFPALICGNTAVLKAAEDTPVTAWYFGRLAAEAGIPAGVLNIVHGLGQEAGEALVDHPDVGVISFTGSTRVGKIIQQRAGARLARISLELGGKNPLVVCEDADLENAVKWTILSAFSNAGQRCAAASRILVFESVYDRFRDLLVEKTRNLRVGPADEDDFGPVINERQLSQMIRFVTEAKALGANVLAGGERLVDSARAGGFYMAPTLLDCVSAGAPISCTELFGPIAILYRVRDFQHALSMANDSPYGLTACIHTRNFHRAIRFCDKVQAGVAVTNAGTFGSEPHMPFGGHKASGNGSREPGTEALNVYSELKDIYLNINPAEY